VAAGPVSRILSAGKLRGKPKPAVRATYHRTTIPLGRASLRGSSDLPGGCDAPSRHVLRRTRGPSLFVLLRVGFALPATLLRGSSDLPGGLRAEPVRAQTKIAPRTALPPYLVLLRVGFALPAPLLERRCALTAPFHPYPVPKNKGGMFSVALSVT